MEDEFDSDQEIEQYMSEYASQPGTGDGQPKPSHQPPTLNANSDTPSTSRGTKRVRSPSPAGSRNSKKHNGRSHQFPDPNVPSTSRKRSRSRSPGFREGVNAGGCRRKLPKQRVNPQEESELPPEDPVSIDTVIASDESLSAAQFRHWCHGDVPG